MGAEQFITKSNGKTAREAFDAAVKQAQHDYGHAGYTGTIAEKDTFVELKVPEGMTPKVFVYDVLHGVSQADTPPEVEKAKEAVDDKWGPAGCVKAGEDEWYFFGYASS